MKLRKYFTSLLAILFLASCSNDGLLEQTHTEMVPKDAVAFSVSFPGSALNPTTYSRQFEPIVDGSISAQPHEKSLAGGVKILVFDKNQAGKVGNLVSVETVDLQSTDFSTIETAPVGGKFYLRKLFGKDAYFVAVANLDFSESQFKALIGKSFQDVANTLVTQRPDLADHFPMVSEPQLVKVPLNGNAGTAKTFKLERLSVRIDIIDETKVLPEFNEKLQVNGYKFLTGGLNQSYLINTLATELFVGDDKHTKSISSNTYKALTPTSSSTSAVSYEAQVYTYENRRTDTKLSIKGLVNSKEFYFEIPFNQPLVRNTIYRVRLKNDDKTKTITHTLEVVDWTRGGEIFVDGNDLKFKPQIVSVKMANEHGVAQAGTVKFVDDKISIGRTAGNLRLVVKSNVEVALDGPKEMTTPWVTVKPLAANTAEPTEQSTADAKVKVYHLNFAKNEDGEKRTAKLVFYTHGNQDKPALRKEIVIEQDETLYEDIVNPLAFFSNRFLEAPHTLNTHPVTFENMSNPEVHGKFFQWGRNVALDFDRTLQPKEIAPSSAEVKTPGVFYFQYNSRKWFAGIPQATDTWQKMVAKAPEGDNYAGNNGGDPCPNEPKPTGVGVFKIPTSMQMRTIFIDPTSNPDELAFLSYKEVAGTFTAQAQCGKETPKNYTFHIKHKTDDQVFYAIVLDETPGAGANKYRTALRYEFLKNKKAMVLTARHLGASGTSVNINTIADSGWWENGAGSDVVRIFPAKGGIGSNGATFTLFCSLWASDAVQDKSTAKGWGVAINWGGFSKVQMEKTAFAAAHSILPIRVE